jgi:hypothetical protein
MDKNKQKQLLIEMMEDDAKLGLYEDVPATASEWLLLQLYEKMEMKGDGRVMDELLQQAKEIELWKIGRFMNWFIKHYSTATIDGMFGWVDSMGREVTIKQILEEYRKIYQ